MTSKFLYYLVIYPISLLPFFILYRISDFLAFVFEYILKYRDDVIRNNIQNSFPKKTKKEVKEIQHIEMIKDENGNQITPSSTLEILGEKIVFTQITETYDVLRQIWCYEST